MPKKWIVLLVALTALWGLWLQTLWSEELEADSADQRSDARPADQASPAPKATPAPMPIEHDTDPRLSTTAQTGLDEYEQPVTTRGPGPGIAMSRAFDDEQRDNLWAPGAERALRLAFDQTKIDHKQLLHLECRASLCRVGLVIRQSDKPTYAAMAASLGRDFGDKPTFLVVTPFGTNRSMRVNMFIPRRGHETGDFKK